MFDTFIRFDGAVFAWIYETLNPGSGGFLDQFFSFVTHLGDGGLFWIALALILLIPNKTRKVGAVMIGALLLDVVINNGILKTLFERPRPFDFDWTGSGFAYFYPGILPERPDEFSFPSGHTGISFAGAMALFLASKPKWVGKKVRWLTLIAVALAALIGFSRIYLGVHYATDVLAGILVGTFCAVLSLLIFQLAQPLYEKINRPVTAFTEKLFAKKK
ncbi:MAG: phosphatase PAP2 family protein [Oscillospiraceae bacterium]|jgi:undecaprenyl-diphosphatase|nr:phosphatase PAP2 family protein [Oscillospiraceae bacterium]